MSTFVYLTRRESFSASHRLHSPKISAEENRNIFGKCNNLNGHGHNYSVEATLRAPIDQSTGMSFSISDLKRILAAEVLEYFDHKNLNLDLPEFSELNPTSENLVVLIWRRLERVLPQGLLFEVKLSETEKNYVTYRGEK